MRRQKHRLCTVLLCMVLTISNILPAGIPVYAKSPESGTVSTDTVDGHAAENDPDTDNASDGNIASGNTAEGDSDSGDTAGNDTGSEDSTGNDTDPKGSSGNDTDPEDSTGNDTDPKDSAGNDTDPEDPSGNDTDPEDPSGNDTDPEYPSGNDTDPEDPTLDTSAPEQPADDVPDEDDVVTVPGSDEHTAAADETPTTDTEYPTAYPAGISMQNITMDPKSYSAILSADIEYSETRSGDITPCTSIAEIQIMDFTSKLKMIYTTEETSAADFFKNSAVISQADVENSSFYVTAIQNETGDWYDTASGEGYRMTAFFRANDSGDFLTPSTTYHYRLAYYSNGSYSFLTAPESFTTLEATTESAITVSQFTAEEIGYQQAMLVWTMDNPDNEEISDVRLLFTDGEENGQSYSIDAYPYHDDSYTKIPGKYYANTYLLGWVKDAAITYSTVINGVKSTLTSNVFPLEPKDIETAEITLSDQEAGSGSFKALLRLSPCYSIDSGYSFNVHYWKKSENSEAPEEKTWSLYLSVPKDQTAGSAVITLTGLASGAAYQYYIEPVGRLGERVTPFAALGSKEQPLSFTTTGVKTYEDSDFPDEIFRNYLKTQLAISESEPLTSDKLETLTQIDHNHSQTSGEIRSLQGIEYLKNLTAISLNGHAVSEGVEGIGSLTSLTALHLNDNDLVSLPDLSKLTQLSFAGFARNKISADTITDDKLPASFLAHDARWCSDTRKSQRGEVSLTVAPEYYQSGDARPFLAKVTGLKSDSGRNYTLSLTINDVTVSGAEAENYAGGMHYIKDILKDGSGADSGITIKDGTPYTATVALTDNYGRKWVEQTAAITFASASRPKAETKYIPANALSAYVSIVNLPASYNRDTVEGVALKDKDGNIVGSASSSNFNFSSYQYNPYEDTFGNISFSGLPTERTTTLGTTVYFARYLSGGDYSAVVTCTDETGSTTDSTFEKAVHVDDTAVLESLHTTTGGSYDNFGDYLYVTVSGSNIDPAKVRPVFYDDDTTITRYVSSTVENDRTSVVYKLEKLQQDVYWNLPNGQPYTFRFESDAGYPFVDLVKNKQLYIYFNSSAHDFVTFEHYNYKKGAYEVKTDSTAKDGTQVTVTVYDCDSSNKNRKELASADAVVQNAFLSLSFTDKEQQPYAPPRYQRAYFNYSYTDSTGKKYSFEHQNYRVEWYNYHITSAGDEAVYADTVIFQEAPLEKLAVDLYVPDKGADASQDITVQINETSAALAKADGAPNGYTRYIGTWTPAAGLGEGIYQIRYLQGDTALYTQELYVYDNSKFYMSSQWIGTWINSSGESNVSIGFSSEQLAGSYIHKYNGNVSNADALAYWKDNGYRLELFDRLGNQIEESIWSVADVYWSADSIMLCLNGLSQEYVGYYARITRNGQPGILLTDGTVYYAATHEANEALGQWHTFNDNRVWFGDSFECNAYYGVGSYSYPVTVMVARPYDTDVIKEFTVNRPAGDTFFYFFTQADLTNIDPNEVYRITGTCADGSSTSAIGYLGVDSRGGEVLYYTLSETSLLFDLASAEPRTLTVSDGTNDISDSVTWSSTDESVATVSEGVVTPVGAGQAEILAAVKNGPTLKCEVTVSRTGLDSASLNTDKITLNIDDSEQTNREQILQLYLTPNDPGAVETITWTSDQPSIASVAPRPEGDTRSTTALVTAVAKGEAKITAVVTTKNGKSLPPVTCKVTVETQTVTTPDDTEIDIPTGLSALTNEQTSLNDVELPAGWTWKYPDVSLKRFAGMQEKSFMAQYVKEEGAVPYEVPLPVSLNTVAGISVTDAGGADSGTLHTGSASADLSIQWRLNGSGFDMSKYADRVKWSIDKAATASLSAASGETVTVRAAGAGKAVVKAEAGFKDGKVYKAQYKLTVTDGEIAEIQVVSIDGFTPAADTGDDVYRMNMSESNAAGTSILHVTATNSTKLTVKNSNAKVVRTGKATAAESTDPAARAFDIPLTINAAGRTKVTLTANDMAKTQKEIWLDVTAAKPNISEDTVTVNLQKTTGTTFFLYPNTSYANAAELPTLGGEGAAGFNLAKGADPNSYTITAREGTATGSYKLTLSGKTITGGKEYPYADLAFTVKVTDQKPKYKLKQNTKVNLFFSDWESLLEVTSDETINSIKVSETNTSDFTVETKAGPEGSGSSFSLKARTADLGTNCSKKMKLTLQFEGYKDITADYTVGVEKKAPKAALNIKSITLYPSLGLHTAQLDPKATMPAGYAFKGMNANLDQAAKEKGISLTVKDEKLWLQAAGIDQNMTIKANLILSNEFWADTITLPFTVKVSTGKPAIKLEKKALQLNTNKAFLNYDMASTEVMWKDGAAFAPEDMSVSAADRKAQEVINSGIVFTADPAGSRIIAKLNNAAVAKGNYKFKVNVKVNSTTTVSAPFTVKVADTAEDKVIRISSKGSIDVLNREGTSVIVTPSLKAINGTVTDAALTGNAAHLFEIDRQTLIQDDKIVIRAKADAALITKYAYKVKLNLTIENAEGGTWLCRTPDISLKLKQGKPKVTVTPKNAVFYSGAYNNAVTRKITAALKGADDPAVKSVELLNNSDGAFVCNGDKIQEQGGTFTLSSTEKAVKGKNYTLQLKVTFKDQADNEKATIVKYSVKVK